MANNELPEPPHRRQFRDIEAALTSLESRAEVLRIGDRDVATHISSAWVGIDGIAGIEMRQYAGALYEVRGTEGAHCPQVSSDRAVTIVVLEGAIDLQREGEESAQRYERGGPPCRIRCNEKHSWRIARGPYRSVNIFHDNDAR